MQRLAVQRAEDAHPVVELLKTQKCTNAVMLVPILALRNIQKSRSYSEKLTLSLVARKQSCATLGSGEIVSVIMLVDMALTEEDARRKLCRGLRGSTVETAVNGMVNSMVFLAISCIGMRMPF